MRKLTTGDVVNQAVEYKGVKYKLIDPGLLKFWNLS